MTIEDIFSYETGGKIFLSVLRRNFGDKANQIVDYLVSESYAIEDNLLRCPYCVFGILQESKSKEELSKSEIYCYACDRTFKPDVLIKERLLVRTDKAWGGETTWKNM